MAAVVPKTWDDIGNLGLTAGQKSIAAAFEAIGFQISQGARNPDISGVTPENAKKIVNFYNALKKLQLANQGAQHVLTKLKENSGKTGYDAVQDGTL